FRSAVTVSALSVPRTASVDAQLVENEDGTYSVTDEVYGTEFADEDLQADLLVQISEALADVSGGQSAFNTGSISLTFPEGIYIKPSVYNNDPVLTRERDVYNSYCKAKITYQYGSETEVLDWSVIKDWVVINPDEAHIDRDLAWAYAQDIAMRYNTRYYERTFHTTTGRTVVFPSGQNEYGYTVNVDGEFGKLLDNISANEEVTREPVYYTRNDYDNPVFYKRNGRDDLAGNYVEVSISDQHLWMYKNGSVIVESDVVTGCVAKGHETACGVFPLAYKKSPDVLVGSNANDGYRTPVDYWMPFYEGQGLHDANWRGSFGGSIYQNSGSHGCVNLPPWAAKAIYENIEAGMAIIIYK
ncbi:MAG: L,D-transpeptidase family protein, partial [Clostridiales bacterium]|nr:L,D-transpeptidase family protein [Candidatus Blautia equi]